MHAKNTIGKTTHSSLITQHCIEQTKQQRKLIHLLLMFCRTAFRKCQSPFGLKSGNSREVGGAVYIYSLIYCIYRVNLQKSWKMPFNNVFF